MRQHVLIYNLHKGKKETLLTSERLVRRKQPYGKTTWSQPPKLSEGFKDKTPVEARGEEKEA